ncbi:hypothetical protein YQE_06543, partial [Dendroctonus ponderosae]
MILSSRNCDSNDAQLKPTPGFPASDGAGNAEARSAEYIGCETTTVRLVSSGAFDNSVTVSFTRLIENDIDMYMSVICNPEDLPTESSFFSKKLNADTDILSY